MHLSNIDAETWRATFSRDAMISADGFGGDTAVELGMMVDGRPLSEATLDAALKRFGSRLTDVQRRSLKSYWRRIEELQRAARLESRGGR